MKRRDFIKGAVAGGSLLGAGMLAGAKETMAAPAGEEKRGNDPKRGLVIYATRTNNTTSFVTYGGHELGPAEAQPALDWINLELAHLEVEIVGKFCCPGKFENTDNPAVYHNDLTTRPNERDLLRADLFMEQVLEAIAERPA